MAITEINGLIKGLASSSTFRFYKPTVASKVAGEIHSLWYVNGFPTIGTLPTTSVDCSSGTVGSWPMPDISIGNTRYLAKVSGCSSVVGQLLVFDRLSHMAGLSGTSTGVQTVNLDVSTAAFQGRCETDGGGVLWCVEHYVATGTTARTLTVTYTNQADVSARTTTVAFKASIVSGMVQPIMPGVADLRIKSIQSVILSATTGTAGNFGITARKRMAEIPIPLLGVGSVADYADLALPDLTGHECLELLYVCGTTSTGNILGSMEIIQG